MTWIAVIGVSVITFVFGYLFAAWSHAQVDDLVVPGEHEPGQNRRSPSVILLERSTPAPPPVIETDPYGLGDDGIVARPWNQREPNGGSGSGKGGAA